MTVDVGEQEIIDAIAHTSKTWVSIEVRLSRTLDPVTLFKKTNQEAGNRFYFRLNDNETAYFGCRVAKEFKNNKQNKRSIFEEWNQFKNDIALIHPQSERHHLRICGGFQFSTKRTSAEWHQFGMNHFILPEILVSHVKGETYLTYTVPVEQFHYETFKEWETFFNTLNDDNASVTLEEQQVCRQMDLDVEEWEQLVANTIRQLDTDEKVVLSRRRAIEFNTSIDIALVLEKALKNEKNSYLFVLESGEDCFISQTPEQLFKVQEGMLSTKAVAGTIKRTPNPQQDKTRVHAFLQDDKNLGEHHIVVESILEDIKPFVKNVNYNKTPSILKNDHLYHLYTEISGTLATSNYIELIDVMHPTPALGGYPKAQAMTYIDAHEFNARGLYGAPVGMIDMNDDSEFIVAIRSMLIQGNQALLFAGAGIVKDSDAKAEVAETALKFSPMMDALGVN
ncbi:isochorismate synthase [Staphylococcus chromogenes]|uniref:isochorismate synthase n=1 Tax=Staphylococcus chromogenes TaxID=46126 RepID=UPI0021D2B934|nr:isochorismate synthase [Staphylococcus chromogenes]UXS75010.1 isochorismate synthase [Staphylococcus chromogenes]